MVIEEATICGGISWSCSWIQSDRENIIVAEFGDPISAVAEWIKKNILASKSVNRMLGALELENLYFGVIIY